MGGRASAQWMNLSYREGRKGKWCCNGQVPHSALLANPKPTAQRGVASLSFVPRQRGGKYRGTAAAQGRGSGSAGKERHGHVVVVVVCRTMSAGSWGQCQCVTGGCRGAVGGCENWGCRVAVGSSRYWGRIGIGGSGGDGECREGLGSGWCRRVCRRQWWGRGGGTGQRLVQGVC